MHIRIHRRWNLKLLVQDLSLTDIAGLQIDHNHHSKLKYSDTKVEPSRAPSVQNDECPIGAGTQNQLTVNCPWWSNGNHILGHCMTTPTKPVFRAEDGAYSLYYLCLIIVRLNYWVVMKRVQTENLSIAVRHCKEQLERSSGSIDVWDK